MTNFQKYKYTYLSLAITLVTSLIFFFQRKQQLDLLSHENIIASNYTDETLGGDSESTLKINGGLNFEYRLGDKYEYAFSGISIDLYNENEEADVLRPEVLNLSSFEFMALNMTTKKGKKIPVQLLTYLEGHSSIDDNNTLVFYEQFLDFDPTKKTQLLPLERFAIPNWWRVTHPNLNTEDIAVALKNVKAINVQSCTVIGANENDQYIISSVQFTTEKIHFMVVLALGLVVCIFLAMYTFFKQKKMLVVSYSQIASKKAISPLSRTNEVLSFINQNYSNPELSVQSLEKELNVNKNKVGELIKKESNLSFKQYLNSIRMLEAKRLLSETDMSISEIAYQIGYSNVSHFNRVFKNVEGCSPSSYKEGKKQR